jgi:hypothetical protein
MVGKKERQADKHVVNRRVRQAAAHLTYIKKKAHAAPKTAAWVHNIECFKKPYLINL